MVLLECSLMQNELLNDFPIGDLQKQRYTTLL